MINHIKHVPMYWTKCIICVWRPKTYLSLKYIWWMSETETIAIMHVWSRVVFVIKKNSACFFDTIIFISRITKFFHIHIAYSPHSRVDYDILIFHMAAWFTSANIICYMYVIDKHALCDTRYVMRDMNVQRGSDYTLSSSLPSSLAATKDAGYYYYATCSPYTKIPISAQLISFASRGLWLFIDALWWWSVARRPRAHRSLQPPTLFK